MFNDICAFLVFFISRRYSLALLDVGYLKSSYIRGNSFHDGFNTALGVFGTNGLTIADNVVHHTVGSAVRVWGRNNKVLDNLAVLSVSPGIAYLVVQTFLDLKIPLPQVMVMNTTNTQRKIKIKLV